jgi:hypothetical protein
VSEAIICVKDTLTESPRNLLKATELKTESTLNTSRFSSKLVIQFRETVPSTMAILAIGLMTLDLYLLLYRGHSLFRDSGTIRWTTGLEEIPIHGIWRVAHGLPAYGWPNQSLDSPALYNALFYYTFGGFARLTNNGSLAEMILHCRLLGTAALAIGLVGHLVLIRTALQDCRLKSPHVIVFTVVVCSWFGSGFVRWFAFSARPDGTAIALSTWGLLCAALTLRNDKAVSERSRRWTLIAASILFFLAWSMKQTAVSFFLAVVVMQWKAHRLRSMAEVVVPFGLGVAVTFFVGGSAYFQNTVVAPSWGDATMRHLSLMVWRGIWPNLFFWATPLLCLGLLRPWRHKEFWIVRSEAGGNVLSLLIIGTAIALPLDIGLAARTGSASYYLWESFVLFGVLSTVAVAYGLLTLGHTRSILFLALTCVALATMTVGSALQAAFPNRYSMLDLANATTSFDLGRRVEGVHALRAPVLIADPTIALASLVARNIYPASVIDPFSYLGSNGHNPFAAGINRLIDERRFCSIVISEGDIFGWSAKAVKSGFVETKSSEGALFQNGGRVFVAVGDGCARPVGLSSDRKN